MPVLLIYLITYAYISLYGVARKDKFPWIKAIGGRNPLTWSFQGFPLGKVPL